MSEDKRAILKQWFASGKATLQPLTYPQRELWEASPVPVADMANHICCLINVDGVMIPSSCEAALQRVVARQEVLRASFLPGKEQAVQMIRQSSEPNFFYRELSDGQAKEEAMEELAAEIFSEPFDLLKGPLYRVELFRRSSNNHVIVFAIHHAIADGWSLGIFVQELCLAYMQELMALKEHLPPVPLTYAAWGAAERAYWQPAEIEKRADFWKANLSRGRRLWDSLEGHATASGPHNRRVALLPIELADALQKLARVSGTTLYCTLLTAFQIALSKWTGCEDMLIGTPVANRNTRSVHETMGYCANVVPLCVRVDPNQSFFANLRSVHQYTVDCFANAMPFTELATALGDAGAPGHNPLFEVRFALQNHPMPDVAMHGLSARLKMRSTGTARFHVGCEITVVSEGLEVVLLSRSKLFPKLEIEKLASMFTAVLESVCRSPETRIAKVMTQ